MDKLIVEVPHWSSETLKPSQQMILGLLPVDTQTPEAKTARPDAFASLPTLAPGSPYPRTSFDQSYIAYESSEGVIVASLERPMYFVVAGARDPRWTRTSLTIVRDLIRTEITLDKFFWDHYSSAAGKLPRPDTVTRVSPSTVEDNIATSILVHRPVAASIPVSAYYDLNRSAGAWRDWHGHTGTAFLYGHSYDQHDGTDYDGNTGDSVYASQVGTVLANGISINCANTWPGGPLTYGTWVRINHGTLSDGNSYQTLYGHLKCDAVLVGNNQQISSLPHQIAEMGNTGYSSGPHTHLNVYRNGTLIDPYDVGIIGDSPGSTCNGGTSTLRNRDSGPPIHPPGSVIKTASNSTVYLIDSDNRKRPITSSSVLSQLYNQSTDARTSTNFTNWVITVGQDELDLYEQGGNISAALPGNGRPFPDGKLIAFDGEVSMVTGGGRRRPFELGQRFTDLGYVFCHVVNVSQLDYESYSEGPPVDAMPLLTSSVNLSPGGPYTVGQNITGSFTIKNVGYASVPFSNLGIGGRLNGTNVYDMNFVSTTLAAGSSYIYGSQPRQLTNTGTYDFFAAYQENNGHWAISVPAASGVVRSRQITVSNSTPTPTPTPNPGPTPANNNFANAQIITGTLGTVQGTNVGATKEGGEPNHAGNAGGASVWYRWQAPSSGSVTFATTGSNFDTLLAAYTGSSVTNLTLIASNDDFNGTLQSAITFNAQGGGVYYLAVDGFGGLMGSIVFGWNQMTSGGRVTTIGLYNPAPSTFFLKNTNAAGAADLVFGFGPAGSGWTPVVGDWNGDGVDTVGLYSPSTSTFFLKNTNNAGAADLVFGFGPAGSGWTPVVGDWNGDGVDTIGLYSPSTSTFFLKNTNAAGAGDLVFGYGPAGSGWTPIVGDWNGDGVDTIGLYSPSSSTFFLKNTNAAGAGDLVFGYGPAGSGWRPVVGDWNGDGIDTIGLYSPSGSNFFLKNTNAAGAGDLVFGYGPAGSGWTPIVGDWNGL